jgi:hypothetical protein
MSQLRLALETQEPALIEQAREALVSLVSQLER